MPVTDRAALKANKVALLPEPVYVYYHRPGSITTAPVSQKSFHFAAHTQAICQDIKARCPEILPQARYLRVWSLAHPMMLCQESGQVKAFRQEYQGPVKGPLPMSFPSFSPAPCFPERKSSTICCWSWVSSALPGGLPATGGTHEPAKPGQLF